MITKFILPVAILFAITANSYAAAPGMDIMSQVELFYQVLTKSGIAANADLVLPIEQDVKFYVASKKNPVRVLVQSGDANIPTLIDFTKEILFVAHGWTDNVFKKWWNATADDYVKYVDGTIITVDWRRLALAPPSQAGGNTIPVGNYVCKFIRDNKLPLDKITLAGHGFGGFIAGIAGRCLGGKVERIIGLDIAGLTYDFQEGPTEFALRPTDAKFVQCLHTNAGGLGTSKRCGHQDYWSNFRGSINPGCIFPAADSNELAMTPLLCNDLRAVQFFQASFNPKNKFTARKCPNYLACEMLFSEYFYPDTDTFGLYAKEIEEGNFYFDTTDEFPFALN